MPTTVIWGEVGLLLNTGGAVLGVVTGRGIVIYTVGTIGGLAVVGAERGTIRPSHGRGGNARAEFDLRTRSIISAGRPQKGFEIAHREGFREKLSLAQDGQRDTVAERE